MRTDSVLDLSETKLGHLRPLPQCLVHSSEPVRVCSIAASPARMLATEATIL